MNEESIFAAALEKSPAERKAFLDQSCQGNAELRAQVEELLSASNAAGSFFEHPPAGLDVTVDAAAHDTHKSANWDGSLAFLKPCDKPGRIGKLVGNAGEYEVIEVVGSGGMGIVLRAFDTKLSRVVAVKVLAPELARNPTAVKRFLREAKAAAAVVHDHVVTIHNVEESHQPPFLVMQYVDGQTLQQKIDKSGALELKEILRIGCQAAAGLAAAHKHGLVHRDVKPSNILLENGVERVKITDFGLARAADDVEITQTGLIAGTPQYMSPEQAKGEPVDARSDLFSLGSVLYTMCTGRPAFRAETTMGVIRRVCDDEPRPIHEVNAELPAWQAAIVGKLLAKNPADRYQTAAEVSELLGQCLAHVQNPGSAPLPGTCLPAVPLVAKEVKPVPLAARRRKFPLAIAVALLVLCLPMALVALVVASFAARYFHPHSAQEEAVLTLLVPRPTVEVTYNGDKIAVTDRGLAVVHVQPGTYEIRTMKGGELASFDLHTLRSREQLSRKISVVADAVHINGPLHPQDVVSRLSQAGGQKVDRQEGPIPIGSSADILTSADWEWTAPENLGPVVNSAATDGGPTLSHDGLTLIFHSDREGGLGDKDLWLCTRPSMDESWSQPANLGPAVNSPTIDSDAELSADGLTLVFHSNRPGGQGNHDLWMCTRTDVSQPWSAAVNLAAVNSHVGELAPALSADGLTLVFNSGRPGSYGAGDLWISTRPSASESWTQPRNLGPRINSPALQGFATLADDGLSLVFNSNREGGPPAGPMRISTRQSPSAEWSEPKRLWNDSLGAWSASLTADAQTMFFDSKREGGHGGFDVWMARRVRKAAANVADASPERPWVPLFNGQDLAGWKPDPDQPGNWIVENDILIGGGPSEGGLLRTERSDYEDFHLRAEVLVDSAEADGGIFFRALPQLANECNFSFDPKQPTQQTGSLVVHKPDTKNSAWTSAPAGLAKPNEWMTVEVIVRGGLALTKVNGKTAAASNELCGNPRGHIMFQHFGPHTVVRFRKIEIKELPPADVPRPANPPLRAVAPFSSAKAKEVQQAWANHLGADVEITNRIGMKLRLIPPGQFTMGSSAEEQQSALTNMEQSLRRVDFGDQKGGVAYIEYLRPLVAAEGPAHRVTLSQPFYIGATEVTAAQFQQFVKETGHETSAERSDEGGKVWGRVGHESSKEFHWRNPCRRSRTPDHPVTQVSYDDALAFCRWLSEEEGVRYDLPTEAQWEFACRAGTQTAWSFGSDPAEIEKHAWAEVQVDPTIEEFEFHEVGRKQANAFGLFDMHGNVQEWCRDFWSPTAYSVSAETDPTGSAAPDAEQNRVIRGGAIFLPHDLRSAIRRRASAEYAENGLGFRVVVVGNLKWSPAAWAWGPVRDGWQVGFGFKNGKLRYAAGEKVEFELKVRNATAGEKTIRIVEPSDWDLWYSGTDELSVRIFGGDEQDVKLGPREEQTIDVPRPLIDLAGLRGGFYKVKVTTSVGDKKQQPEGARLGFEYEGPVKPPFAAPAVPLTHPDAQYAAVAWGQPVLGLSLGIAAREAVADSPRELEFLLWNADSKPATLSYIEHHPLDWQPLLRDKDGKEYHIEPILTGPKTTARAEFQPGQVISLGTTTLKGPWLSDRRPVGDLAGAYHVWSHFNCRRLDYGHLNLRLTSGEARVQIKP